MLKYFKANIYTKEILLLILCSSLLPALPLEVYLIWSPFPWIFGLVGCQMMSVFTEIVAYVSIFTMIAFTFERYLWHDFISLRAQLFKSLKPQPAVKHRSEKESTYLSPNYYFKQLGLANGFLAGSNSLNWAWDMSPLSLLFLQGNLPLSLLLLWIKTRQVGA